jgi:hypothetical protein
VDGIGSESFPLVIDCWWGLIALALDVWVITIRGFDFYSVVITALSFVYRKVIFTYDRQNDEELSLLTKNVFIRNVVSVHLMHVHSALKKT